MKGNYVSLDVAKREYCLTHQIVDKSTIDQIALRHIGRNENNEYVFSVKAPFKGRVVDSIWALERRNGRTVMGKREISLPKSERNPDKPMVVRLFNNLTGLQMREADIAKVVLKDDVVDVIFHPDSMTFENYLTIKRI